MLTKDWLLSVGLSPAPNLPPIEGEREPFPRDAIQIARRTLVLQGLQSIAAGAEREPIVDWFKEQKLDRDLSPAEKRFLKEDEPAERRRMSFLWHKEAQWVLLWAIGKVDSLGLPTKECDSAFVVDEVMPALGSDVDDFVDSAAVRAPGLLLAEDLRSYNMWCYAQKARAQGSLPQDLNMGVLYERRYAFEWLDAMEDWDEISCDA